MMRRGGLPLALIVVAAWAFLVPAAQAAFEVSGSGSFNRAPLLQPGDYADTIQTTEDLFYAIRLKRGEKLTVSAVLRRDRTDKPVAQAELRVRIYNASRQEIPSAYGVTNLGARGDVTVETSSPGVTDGQTTSGSQTQFAPGTYYVSINLNDARDVLGKREIPLEFSVTTGTVRLGTAAALVALLALVVGLVFGLRTANRAEQRRTFRKTRRSTRARDRK